MCGCVGAPGNDLAYLLQGSMWLQALAALWIASHTQLRILQGAGKENGQWNAAAEELNDQGRHHVGGGHLPCRLSPSRHMYIVNPYSLRYVAGEPTAVVLCRRSFSPMLGTTLPDV